MFSYLLNISLDVRKCRLWSERFFFKREKQLNISTIQQLTIDNEFSHSVDGGADVEPALYHGTAEPEEENVCIMLDSQHLGQAGIAITTMTT